MKMVAQLLNRAGKRTWRLDCVVCATGGGGGSGAGGGGGGGI